MIEKNFDEVHPNTAIISSHSPDFEQFKLNFPCCADDSNTSGRPGAIMLVLFHNLTWSRKIRQEIWTQIPMASQSFNWTVPAERLQPHSLLYFPKVSSGAWNNWPFPTWTYNSLITLSTLCFLFLVVIKICYMMNKYIIAILLSIESIRAQFLHLKNHILRLKRGLLSLIKKVSCKRKIEIIFRMPSTEGIF